MRVGCWVLAGVVSLLAAGPRADVPGPRELYDTLNQVRPNAAEVYTVKEITLRRDVVRISFLEGKLAFLTATDGQVTGAVFSGRGRALALVRDPVEKSQLARFLGAPLLDQTFTSGYFRFSDNTAEELRRLLQEAGAKPAEDSEFAAEWNDTTANLNSWHSLRILADRISREPRPYFYAGLVGENTGPFDILLDPRRSEPVLIGQPKWVSGEKYQDVWASFSQRGAMPAPEDDFVPVAYSIDTTIHDDLTLEGTTALTLKAVRGGERAVLLELSRFLKVNSAADSEGHPLVFFQNEALNRQDIAQRGNDSLMLVLPAAPEAGAEFRLQISYKGAVIGDAGNSVYFVAERGSWYAHVAGLSVCTPFELSFRWPKQLQLVATGKKIEEREEGNARSGRWRSDVPFSVAGFNLGAFITATLDAGNFKIELYANRQLEQFLSQRYRRHAIISPVVKLPGVGERPGTPGVAMVVVPDPPPNPSAVLKDLGGELADAARFIERFNGPFPYDHVAITQIPGMFGQGWPELVYLSTFSFLSPTDQSRMGMSSRTQEHFSEIVPFHEVAHQWWGNVVTTPGYRDLWIQEGLANYIALMFADTLKTPDHSLPAWLNRYRTDLLAKPPGREDTYEEMGPVVLGYRLRSSVSPGAYERVFYGKSTWIFHMLRSMLREPGAKNPDARFAKLLQTLVEQYRYKPLSTDDLQRAVEAVATPSMLLEGGRSMDWFFDEWVRSTGIPRYSISFKVQPQGQGLVVRGVLKQEDVPDTFVAPVPIYAARASGKPVFLGTVVASGKETPFRFAASFEPRRLVIDPQLTVLCVTQ